MESLPKHIRDYIRKVRFTPHFPAYLKLTPAGVLEAYGGRLKHFGITTLAAGRPAGESAAFLAGVFPLQTPGVILPRVETVSGVIADIHVFKEDDHCVWVLLLDESESEKQLRAVLQKNNELQLIEEKYKKLLRDNISIAVLNRLNIAVFRQEDDQKFKIIGTLPHWIIDISAAGPSIGEQPCMDPVQCFPFLEFFLLHQAGEIWESVTDNIVVSDLWIENPSEKKEVYLEATALWAEGKKILLIRRVDAESSKDYMHIQKGREKSLAYEKAVKAERMMKTFLANMSHELRTPMNAVIGISKMLGKYHNHNLTGKQMEGLRLISESGERLLNLINSLLDLSRIEAGKMPVAPAPVSTAALMTDISQMTEPLLKDKDIEFVLRAADDIPERIITDSGKVHQVLMNLLGNAVKFTGKGRITLAVYPKDRRLYFEVRDSGIGISQDHLGDIFNAFTQVDGSRAREYGGAGLGLALCKKLVTLMGGDISVSSRLGEGSVFTFYIPLQIAPAA